MRRTRAIDHRARARRLTARRRALRRARRRWEGDPSRECPTDRMRCIRGPQSRALGEAMPRENMVAMEFKGVIARRIAFGRVMRAMSA